jgi:hypothetical protein
VYDIRGQYIHKANTASQPVYEIRSDYIHKAHSALQPEFEIRGDMGKWHGGVNLPHEWAKG